MKLSELAATLGLTHDGDDCEVSAVADLGSATAGQLAFVYDPKYLDKLATSKASAFILKQEWRDRTEKPVLISSNPRLHFAHAAATLHPAFRPAPAVAPSAVIAEDVDVPASAFIGPGVVIEQGVVLGEGVQVGAGTVIARNSHIGDDTVIFPNVSIGHGCRIGSRCEINSGTVIGTDGFGYVNDGGKWVKVPQLGTVVIGDDVDIGSNVTIDRGALKDTIIHDGVKLDNTVQVAHNVEIGENTLMSGFSGAAGSARIGKNCLIGGGVGIRDNIEIADGVIVTGRTFVSNSLKEPGSYSSSILVDKTERWRKNVMRFRKLDEMARRISQLEKTIAEMKKPS